MLKLCGRLLVLIVLLAGCGGIVDSVRTPLIGFGDIEAEYHFDNEQSSWDTFRLQMMPPFSG